MRQKSYDGKSTLYIIPTPIGNLEDITLRALNILKDSDIIFCEDTRITKQLLTHFDINTKLISNHKYNEYTIKEKILFYLEKGSKVSLVSDRGTPGISDPGFVAIKYIIDNGYNIVCLPGANAFVPALIMSGINPQPFLFYGFLNSKDSKQKEELKKLEDYEYTLIFYEAPHRIKKTLKNISDILGNRVISLVREISKVHEEIIRDNIDNIIPIADTLKGEFVIVVEGKEKQEKDYSNIDIVAQVNNEIMNGLTEKEAIKKVAKERKVLKNEVYMEYHRR